MTRIYGEKTSLDYAKVAAFFERRSQKIGETGPLSVTMYQTEDMARLRDEHEKGAVLPLLGVTPETRVLDIGCGTGRWGQTLFGKVARYLGTDFNPIYVQAGREAVAAAGLDADRYAFQQIGATELSGESLSQKGPFDLVIIAGLTAFLNDEDVQALFQRTAALVASNGVVYIREPLALNDRLTLVEHPSEQLADDYTAIYRTAEEMRSMIQASFLQRPARIETEFELFPPALHSPATSAETAQRVYIINVMA